ncbi:MAG: hypothetical protein CM15mP71_2670 [Candidatus Poseidoniales archaeon]|nr:MAG: hypothetical protein CM15mP71_2670 [Candidatus Poseidoniales archaeon]
MHSFKAGSTNDDLFKKTGVGTPFQLPFQTAGRGREMKMEFMKVVMQVRGL